MSKILIIDDDSLQRAFLKAGLEKLGYEVRVARNGIKALSLMSEEFFSPSLVITDMVMPDMDGLEVIQYFRVHHPEIPVVAISGRVPETYLQLATRMGAQAALTKPIHPATLGGIVDTLLGANA